MSEETQFTNRIKHHVEEICKHGPRLACSPQEEAAANYMKNQMEELGLDVKIQRFRTSTTFGAYVLLPVLFALAGTMLIPYCPFGAMVIILLSAIGLWGEASAKRHYIRRFFPGKISQNVIGHYKPENPKQTIIFSGHLDSAQAGLMFSSRVAELATGGPKVVGPLFLPLTAMVVLMFVAIISWFGGSGFLINFIDWIGAIVLVLTALMMIQWMRSPTVPGANDNASGIASALVMAETLMAEKPEDLELYFIGFGAEENHLGGSRSFVHELGHNFDPESTYVINVDGIAAGKLKYVSHEMMILPYAYEDQELIVMARSLSRSDQFDGVIPAIIEGHTDALSFGLKGFKAISLICTEDNGIPLNYHQTGDAPENMPYDGTEKSMQFVESLVAAIRA